MSILQLPRQVELGIAMLVIVAESKGATVSTPSVARVIGTTDMHAAKIAHTLAKAGLLEAQRGRSGGLTLTRSSSRIPLSDPISAIDPGFFGKGRHDKETPITPVLSEVSNSAANELIKLYKSCTILDLVERRQGVSGTPPAFQQPFKTDDCPQ